MEGGEGPDVEYVDTRWMEGGEGPDVELFYIWAFPTLHPTGINIFVCVYALLLHP